MADMPGMNMPAAKGPMVPAHPAAPSGSSLHPVSGVTGSGRGAAGQMSGMRMGRAPVIDVHTILADWQVSIFPVAVAAVLVGVAVWYLWSVRRVRVRGRGWSGWRVASFVSGLVAVELALGSSVASLSMFTFTAHVFQHLFLMVVAPPLLALGAPMTLLLQTSRRRTKRWALLGLHSRVFGVVRHPITVFFLYYLSMYAFFLSAALGYAMAHMWLMDVINVGFLFGATLFWWPMVGIDPIPGGRMHPGFKLLNVLIGVPVESFLGIAIMMQSTPLASMYTLSSTHTGGGILWVGTEIATLAALGPIYFEWVRSDARAARRVDAALASGTYQAPTTDGRGATAALRSLRRE